MKDAESGKWATARDAAQRAANVKRAEAAKEQHAISNPRAGERKSGPVSEDTRPERRDHIAENARASVTSRAKASGVSSATQSRVERVASLAGIAGAPQPKEQPTPEVRAKAKRLLLGRQHRSGGRSGQIPSWRSIFREG